MNMLCKKCKQCKKEFTKPLTCSLKVWRSRTKYCSKKCADSARVGKPAWNKGKKGLQIAWNKGKKMEKPAWNKGLKIKQTKGNKNGKWKGDSVGYFGKHSWIEREKGKAKHGKCVDCGITSETARLEWSNISGNYRRSVDDYSIRCVKCHRAFDKK